MTNIENDVWETIKLSGHYKHNSFDKYGPVYPYSNENLDKLFSCVDVCGKDVLTVASSGDHAFYSYNNGANRVDLFDINILTKYYYYLRMWVIKYFDNFYFDNYKLSKKDESIRNTKREDEFTLSHIDDFDEEEEKKLKDEKLK